MIRTEHSPPAPETSTRRAPLVPPRRAVVRLLSLASLVLALGCSSNDAPRPEPRPSQDPGSGSASAAPAAASPSTRASAGSLRTADGVVIHEKEVLSQVYEVDHIYKSMRGPQSSQTMPLLDAPVPELLWVVGFEAVMVSPDGQKAISQEFMCHSNLDFDAAKHSQLFGDDKTPSERLFTLSQGQQRIDFPDGFGIPILSSETLSLNTQVLNLNMKEGKAEVRHKIRVRFVRDKDLKTPYKPLFAGGAWGLKALEAEPAYFGESNPDPMHQGPGCMPGQNAAEHEYADAQGRRFTGHWIVKPGREENHTLVTHLMNVPFDTTIHYIAIHLHPFAESLELRDLTTGTSVYKATTKQTEGAIGLAHVDYYTSVEGLPIYKDHEYELVSIYDNTTSEEQDSMAVMNMYMLDKLYKRPDLSAVEAAKPK